MSQKKLFNNTKTNYPFINKNVIIELYLLVNFPN